MAVRGRDAVNDAARVDVERGEPIERALRRLKRAAEPILAVVRDRAAFTPPGERRRRKANRARKRARRLAARRADREPW